MAWPETDGVTLAWLTRDVGGRVQNINCISARGRIILRAVKQGFSSGSGNEFDALADECRLAFFVC